MLNKTTKKIAIVNVFLLFFTMTGFFPAAIERAHAVIQASYYVSPAGSDSNPGTLAQPFLTIQKARDVVRTINSSMTGDIMIYLRGGIYPLTSTLALTNSDSGTNGYNVIYRAYNSEVPIISGGQQVTGWTQVGSSNIWKASVSLDRVRQFYVNDQRLQRARSAATYKGTAWYDDPSPTVVKLGDGTVNVTILATATANLVFSETLSAAGKTAVETALTEQANQVITYSWNGGNDTLTITGHATNTTTFGHDVVANVEDTKSQTSKALLLVDSLPNASAPTVTKLGDGSADVTIADAGTVNLVFNEVLSTAGKTAVETALTAGADFPITYSWNGGNNTLTITGHATEVTTFANDVRANVSDAAGNKAIALLLVDSVDQADNKDGFYVHEDALGFYANAPDMELHWSIEWKSYHHKIDRILDDGGQRVIVMQQPDFDLGGPDTNFTTIKYDSPFYIENAYELLDTPGEWYFNRTTDELYYWPKDGENMATVDAYVPKVEELLTIEGSSLSNKAHNIQFYGITFEYGTWLRPDQEGVVFHQAGAILDYGDPDLRALANVYVEYATDLLFERNVFQHLGGTAIALYNGVHDSTIIGNVFHDISEGAVAVGTNYRKATLQPGEEVCFNNLVSNNLIRDTGAEYWSSVAIIGYMTDTLEISHNDIKNNPYSGISVGWDWTGTGVNSNYSKNNKIQNNKVDTVMRTTADGGGIYTLGKQTNSLMQKNYIRNVMIREKGAIYPDQGTSYYTISDNVIENIHPNNNWLFIWNSLAHDLTVNNNYTTDSSIVNNGGANITISNTHTPDPSGNWPTPPPSPTPTPVAASTIISNSGLEVAYQDLLTFVTAGDNHALFKTVTTSSTIDTPVWDKSNVNDGWQAGLTGSNTVSNGFSSIPHIDQNSNEWIEIDLGSNKTFNNLRLFPRTDEPAYGGGSANFPVDFTIQVKPNAGSYSTVKTVAGQSDPKGTPQGYYLGNQTARYVKINVTKLGTPAYFETLNYRLQLTEIEVFNDTALTASTAFTGTYVPVVIPALLEKNIAIGKPVTASSTASVTGILSTMNDGDRTSLWVSSLNLFANHTEWASVDLGKRYVVSRVDLYPRNSTSNVGENFPIDFTIKVSPDNVTWYTVITKTSYAKPDASVQSFSFEPMNVRYIKVEGTSLRPNAADGNSYRMGFEEIEVYGSNVALKKTITASSTVGIGTGWYKDDIVDGFKILSGWSSSSNLGTNHTEWVKVDLGDSYPVSQVDLYPRNDIGHEGQGFPLNFTIQVSPDDTNWTTVVTETSPTSPTPTPSPLRVVQRYSFTGQNARYIKVEGTSLRQNPSDSNQYRMQIKEMEVYGGSKALNKAVTASSSIETGGWFMDNAVDGLRSGSGWSSNNTLGSNHTEWITVDMGASQSISKVDVYPRNDAGNIGQGFPVDFTIQVSADNTNWTTVITRTAYALPGNAVQSFTFTAQNARYVKINGTSLRQNPSDNNYFRMVFNDIEIY